MLKGLSGRKRITERSKQKQHGKIDRKNLENGKDRPEI